MTVTHRDVVSPPGLGPQQEDGQAGEADGAEEAVAAAGLLQRGGHVAHLARAAAQRVPAHRAVPAAAAHVLLPSVRHCRLFVMFICNITLRFCRLSLDIIVVLTHFNFAVNNRK